MRLRSQISAIAFVTSVAVSFPALAQPESGQLQDVVVTAQKRSENLQKVPISVTAVTAETLILFLHVPS